MSLRLTQEEFDAIKSGAQEKKPVRLRQNDNKYKAQVELIFMALMVEPVREMKFLPERKFRFDWAFPPMKLAVEYEGIVSEKSRHTSILGYTRDAEKYSLAAIEGWCVVRVTALMLENGLAHSLIKQAVDSRRIGYETIGERNMLTGEEL